MRPTPLLALTIAIAAAARCAADDCAIRDVRLTAGVAGESQVPVIEFYDTGRGRGTNQPTDDDRTRLRAGPRVGVTLVQSVDDKLGTYGGVIVGLGYAYQHETTPRVEHDAVWTDSSGNVIAQAFRDGPIKADINAVDLHVGWAYPVARRCDVELLAFGGLGSMTMSDNGPFITSGPADTPHDSTNGPYREGGARLGLWYRGRSGGLIGLEGGFIAEHGRGATTTNLTGTALDRRVVYTIDWRTTFAQVSVGFHF